MLKMSDLAPHFREMRRAAKLSQVGVAKRAGVSQAHISDMDRGAYAVTFEAAAAYAEVCGYRLRFEFIKREKQC